MEYEGELISSSKSLFDSSVVNIFQRSEVLLEEPTNGVNTALETEHEKGQYIDPLIQKIHSLEQDNVTLLEELEKVSTQLSYEVDARQKQEKLVENLRLELHEMEKSVEVLRTDVCVFPKLRNLT